LNITLLEDGGVKLNNPTFYLKKLFINIDFCTKAGLFLAIKGKRKKKENIFLPNFQKI